MITKVDALKGRLLADIQAGRLEAGAALPSRHQLMRRYRLSRGTVDAAITGLSRLGYVRSLRGAGSFVAQPVETAGTIDELCVFDQGDVGPMLEAELHVGRLAKEFEHAVPCHLFDAREAYLHLDRLSRPGVAVIWVRPAYDLLPAMRQLAAVGRPQLLIGRTYADFDHVTTDAAAGIRTGLAWLAEAGDEVAFVSEANNPDCPYIAERMIAFYRACLDLGLRPRPDQQLDLDRRAFNASIRAAGKRLFGCRKPSRAVFLASFNAALSLVAAAETHGRRPGRDFRLLLFDAEPRLADSPGIGMLRQRWDGMAQSALDWLRRRRRGDVAPWQVRIEPELIVS
jgi:DNA-binding LacI/PurR family transcriptional regulator